MIRFSFAASVFHFDDPLIQDYSTKNRSYDEFKYLPKLSPLCRLTVSDSSRLACFLVIQISGWSIKHVYELQWIPCSARLRIHSYSSRYRYMRLLYTQCPVPPGKVDQITLDKITVLKNITVQSQTGTLTTQIWKKRKKGKKESTSISAAVFGLSKSPAVPQRRCAALGCCPCLVNWCLS